MLPPSEPVVQTLEKYVNLFFFTALSWVWVRLEFLFHEAASGNNLAM